MKKKSFGALSAMCGQAGTRIVVGMHIRGDKWVRSTHYANLAEFLKRIKDEELDIDWYQVKGQDKVWVDDQPKEIVNEDDCKYP